MSTRVSSNLSVTPPVIHRRLVLASASPRRHDLLKEAGFDFEVCPANIDETTHPTGLAAGEIARWLAMRKAAVIADRFPADVILAADTIVTLGDRLLGKPDDAEHATRMLRTLSGTTHQVMTGIAVVCRPAGVELSEVATSSVQMRKMSDREIADYVSSGRWAGKAGGYGIQDRDPFVTRISGELTNIVGLPIQRTIALLAQADIRARAPLIVAFIRPLKGGGAVVLSDADSITTSAVCLLIGAAGWYYLFYSRAAQNLSGIEAARSNRRRVRLRRFNGIVMISLAILLYVANHMSLLKERPLAATAVMAGIIVLLGVSVVLGWVDVRMTMDLRNRRRDDRDRHDEQ